MYPLKSAVDHVKHTKLADNTKPTDTEKSLVDSYLESTLVLFQRQPMPYEFYKGRDSPSVREYIYMHLWLVWMWQKGRYCLYNIIVIIHSHQIQCNSNVHVHYM